MPGHGTELEEIADMGMMQAGVYYKEPTWRCHMQPSSAADTNVKATTATSTWGLEVRPPPVPCQQLVSTRLCAHH